MSIISALIVSGCTQKVTDPAHQIRDVDGMIIEMSARSGLPQDFSSGSASSGAQAGDDTLVVTLKDDKTDAPIPNANISAWASNSLVGDQRAESGRAQGNGIYLVPIRFAVPDTYDITVSVQRISRQPSTAQFKITAN